jgi:pyruvate/2-oxoglutarate dehydrogenase complex dihydrolipoamide acyltransferase (E2) component
MAIEIQVPKLGLTMEEATLVCWKFAAAEMIRKEQIVLVLETDKVTFEMPSPGDGLLHPVVPAPSRIVVGQVVGYLVQDRAELSKLSAQYPAAEAGACAPEPAAPEAAAEIKPAGGAPDARVKASPVARAMARVHGIELGGVAGSGPGGRILRADILAALEKGIPARKAPAAPPAPGEILTAAREIPIAGVRKAIFKNMHLSLSTQAQLTLHTEASAEALTRLRNRLNEGDGNARVSFNAILVKVIACALRQHPQINAGVEGDLIRIWQQIHVGVAMDAGRGLVVPKVRNADLKTIREIAADMDRLAASARDGSLTLDDLTRGTFTLTNLGAWDVDDFTPIVNHPESAILGIGRMVEKPVARDGQVIVERRAALSLSFDHRIIDGAPGAAFLKNIKEMIEEPALML